MGVLIFGILVSLSGLCGSVAAQKGSFPDITQLQGPQKPRVGFMLLASANGPLTEEQDKQVRARLARLIDSSYIRLKGGFSAAAVAKSALRSLTQLKRSVSGSGIIVLDKRGRLTAAGNGEVLAIAAAMCASASSGPRNGATEVCAEVQQHANTVQSALNGYLKKHKTDIRLIVVLDKFGNMAMSEASKQGFIGYLASDGKAILK